MFEGQKVKAFRCYSNKEVDRTLSHLPLMLLLLLRYHIHIYPSCYYSY